MTKLTIARADAIIAEVAEMRDGAEVAYTLVCQSSQWQQGFNIQGHAWFATLQRNGKTLVEDNPHLPGSFVALQGAYSWNCEEARICLADTLAALYDIQVSV